MKARIRRTCTLIAVLAVVTLLGCVYAAADDETISIVGVIAMAFGLTAWWLDDRPKVEPPAF
jgi:1,4-dihydroxy-2-naphthoate octaprenyltransferase